MTVKNCVKCGKLFMYVNRNVCPDCVEKEEQDYNKVRDYLKEHPGARVEEIGRETEVEEGLIMRFLREGRLITMAAPELECLSCRAPILHGSLCEKCSKAVSHDIEVVQREKQATDQAKHKERDKWKSSGDRIMFTADWNRRK
ncbi:MAG: flagellar protein [Thermincolia bacterium]